MKNKRDEEIFSLAKPLVKEAEVEVNGKSAEIIYPDKYEEMLPEDISMDTVKAVNKHNKQYIDTMVCAAAETSKEVFSKNKKVEEITSNIGFEDNGSINIQINKSKAYRNPSNGEETNSPAIRTIVKSSGSSGSKAFHKRLKTQLAESISG